MLCCIFVCKIMLKLCVSNVKTPLLYYKPKLIIRLCPIVSEHGKTFLNLFYNIILKLLKKALTVV